MSAAAYARTARTTASPREAESALLLHTALKLELAAARAETSPGREADEALDAALAHVRKLWTVLATAATETQSPLPAALQSAVASLAVFVLRRSFAIASAPSPSAAASAVVEISRQLAAGLRGNG
jgi:flagellar protein FlaF